MEIKIQAKNFQEAIDIAFRDFGIVSNEILDFDELEDGVFTIKVNKTIDSEVRLNNQVKELISSNEFTSNDIAFVCSDSELHTPSGENLFERIKSLLRDGLVPVIGFSNFIEASDKWSELKGSIANKFIAYNDLILSKEGNLLKGTKFEIFRGSNSKMADPIFEMEVECNNADSLVEKVNGVLDKVNEFPCCSALDKRTLLFSPCVTNSISSFNILLLALGGTTEIKRFKIKGENFTLRGDMK